MKALRTTALGAALALGLVAAPALGLDSASTASSEVPVTIVSRAYQPAQLTIEDGQSVVWTNRGFTPHTVTALGGEFNSERLNAGESYKVTFTTPGTFAYKCTIHPSMRGEVTVLAPGQHPPPAGGLQVRLSPAHTARGKQTLIHVQAPRPGAGVLLQQRYPATAPWRTVRRAHLSPQGKATLAEPPSARGRLRVVVQAVSGGTPLIGKPLAPGA